LRDNRQHDLGAIRRGPLCQPVPAWPSLHRRQQARRLHGGILDSGLNSRHLDVAESEATRMVAGPAAGEVDEDALTVWCSDDCRPERPGGGRRRRL